MAFVTRCPYCRSVWLLPDRQTAESGSVKCADCNRSFDPASEMLEVPDELFPERSSGVSKVTSLATPPRARERMNELKGMMDGFDGRTPPRVGAIPATAAAVSRKDPVMASPAGDGAGSETEAISRIVPGEARSVPPEGQIRSLRPADPVRIVSVRKRKSGAGSVFLALVLVIAIAAVAAVAFNQQVVQQFPQARKVFNEVCQRVTCPGFYLEEISSFVVSRTNLRSLDESGNYVLEITLLNSSSIAQKVPNLEIELVDGADATLLHRTLRPAEYLDDPENTKSIAPGRPVTIRFNMQTNVIPARCIVNPVY